MSVSYIHTLCAVDLVRRENISPRFEMIGGTLGHSGRSVRINNASAITLHMRGSWICCGFGASVAGRSFTIVIGLYLFLGDAADHSVPGHKGRPVGTGVESSGLGERMKRRIIAENELR